MRSLLVSNMLVRLSPIAFACKCIYSFQIVVMHAILYHGYNVITYLLMYLFIRYDLGCLEFSFF